MEEHGPDEDILEEPDDARPLRRLRRGTEDEETCVICFERPRRRAALVGGCDHTSFCLSCITTWAETNNCCPVCRARFVGVRDPADPSCHIPVEHREPKPTYEEEEEWACELCGERSTQRLPPLPTPALPSGSRCVGTRPPWHHRAAAATSAVCSPPLNCLLSAHGQALSGFMFFCQDYREEAQAQVGSGATHEIQKVLGEKWGQTTDRQHWEKLAGKDKLRHDAEMAKYNAGLEAEAEEERLMKEEAAAGQSAR